MGAAVRAAVRVPLGALGALRSKAGGVRGGARWVDAKLHHSPQPVRERSLLLQAEEHSSNQDSAMYTLPTSSVPAFT